MGRELVFSDAEEGSFSEDVDARPINPGEHLQDRIAVDDKLTP